nr:MAG TPA: hypothetical protein [Caudoviricetes sp.]
MLGLTKHLSIFKLIHNRMQGVHILTSNVHKHIHCDCRRQVVQFILCTHSCFLIRIKFLVHLFERDQFVMNIIAVKYNFISLHNSFSSFHFVATSNNSINHFHILSECFAFHFHSKTSCINNQRVITCHIITFVPPVIKHGISTARNNSTVAIIILNNYYTVVQNVIKKQHIHSPLLCR